MNNHLYGQYSGNIALTGINVKQEPTTTIHLNINIVSIMFKCIQYRITLYCGKNIKTGIRKFMFYYELEYLRALQSIPISFK